MTGEAQAVLGELLRVARHVLVLDFTAPHPWNAQGVFYRLVELSAGFTHFSGFLSFQRRRGVRGLVEEVQRARKANGASGSVACEPVWASSGGTLAISRLWVE